MQLLAENFYCRRAQYAKTRNAPSLVRKETNSKLEGKEKMSSYRSWLLSFLCSAFFFSLCSGSSSQWLKTVTPETKAIWKVARNVLTADPKDGEPAPTFGDVALSSEFQQLILDTGVKHLGGPMLGCVTSNSVKVWLRAAYPASISVVLEIDDSFITYGPVEATLESNLVAIVQVDNLQPLKSYHYTVLVNDDPINIPNTSRITTAPKEDSREAVRIAFGADPHIWGLSNIKQADTIRNRNPAAMLLFGDLAVQDKKMALGKHRGDYLTRDLFTAWRSLVSAIPVYAVWDDHDYIGMK